MRLPAPPRRARGDAGIVPMINIVFLLLVFFLMVATLPPAEPLPVAPPEADTADPAAEGSAVLHVTADGALAFGAARGEAVFAALAERPDGPLTLRADADLPGTDFAVLLARLAAAGVPEVALVVTSP